ncbi:hypothetical protein [Streptomyces sp. HNM0574]|uniref:hypothetical protein n=1 Tax=Streptomyces sp. HNM0574 TaxID=2714954 RepID=UPI001F0E454F|nr:hypothetical protein [Streptomyces sp. HNM0574]
MPREQELEPELRVYGAQIARPDGHEVFRRHLLLHGIPPEEYLHSAPVLDEFLGELPAMEAIADFADRVRRVRAADQEGGLPAWCERARDARKEWRKEAAAQVAALREAPQRALLFTTAMLHGAHADVVHDATGLLLRALGTPQDETPLLARRDLAERLSEIDASTGRDGHVRFDRPDYDTAVRTHFWDHMPDLRNRLGKWAARALEQSGPYLAPELRRALAERLADQYLRTGRRDGLASLAEEWAERGSSRSGVEAAVHALTRGLEHRWYGGSFRRLLYDWCTDKRLTPELAYVLIRVCTDSLAPTHPDQAVVRLHHLARREQGSTAAQEALCGLVETSGRLRRRMLDRLTQPASPEADTHLFLRICDPRALTDPDCATRALLDEKGVRDCVTAGWARALGGVLERPQWQPYAERWLHSASAGGRHGGLLLDLLVDAAGRDGTRLAELYAAARAAEPTSPHGRRRGGETTAVLLRKISAAQGLRPPAAPPRPEPSVGSTP